jgi:hypothetical protein
MGLRTTTAERHTTLKERFLHSKPSELCPSNSVPFVISLGVWRLTSIRGFTFSTIVATFATMCGH